MLTLAVLGAGRIGSAIGIRVKTCLGARVLATRRDVSRLNELRRLGFEPRESNKDAAREADVVVIAVKPHVVKEVAEDIRDVVEGKPVVSVAAGVKLEKLRRLLPGAIVYRAMPNLGVVEGVSVTALAGPREHPSSAIIEKIFRCCGEVFWVDEKLMPAWTALASSSLALLASLADAMLLAGLKMGFKVEEVKRLIPALFRSVAILLERLHPIELRDSVATPGGVTIEGLVELEKGGREALIRALLACFEKACRLEGV